MWEESAGIRTSPGVTVTLTGISFGVTDPDTQEKVDKLTIQYELEQETTYAPADWTVDFLSKDIWYTVYDPMAIKAKEYAASGGELMRPPAANIHYPGSEEMSFRLPQGVLKKTGSYRLGVPGYGYCYFELPLEGDKSED